MTRPRPAPSFHRQAAAGCLLLAGVQAAAAQAAPPATGEPSLQELQRQVETQIRRLDELRRTLEAEQARLRELRHSLGDAELGTLRATGSEPATTPVPATDGSLAVRRGGQGQAQASAPTPVGQEAREAADRPAPVAQIFEQPGVLTPKGRFVFEPSLQYSYSSNTRVAMIGYSVLPALLVGLIDAREVKRNTLTAALTGRFGLTNRLELEVRVPYVYRSDDTVSREIGTGTAADRVFETSGRGIGDVELAARYQFNNGGADRPYFIGGLRFKTRTGRDPFEVTTDCVTRCTGNATGTGLPLDLPTGTGFYSIQPSLTWLLPSDPAVLFGSFSYLHHFKRHVQRTVLGGEREDLGDIEPGAAIGVNIGVGLSLNERSSVSFGYDHSSVARTRQNGQALPGSVRLQLGTLVLGYSHRLNDKRSLNVSIGAGLTRDTPDLTLTVRMPFNL